MAKLAHELGGFPLLLGGIVGVGVGVLKWLESMDAASTKSLNAITALSEGIAAAFKHTQTEVAKIAAESAGDRERVSRLSAQQEIDDAETIKNARIAKAKEELGQIDFLGNKRTELSKEALAEIVAAEADFANKSVVINAKKNADLAKLEQDRKAFHLANLAELTAAEAAATQATLLAQGKVLEASDAGLEADTAKAKARLDAKLEEIQKLYQATSQGLEERRTAEAKYQQDVIALEANAAKQRQTIIEGLTTAALASLKGLGAGFEDIEQKLTLATFLQNTQKAVAGWLELGVAIANGDKTLTDAGLTIQNVQDVVKALTQQMQDAISHGIVPMTDAVESLTDMEKKWANEWTRGFGEMHNEVSDLITEINDITQAFVTFQAEALDGTNKVTQAVSNLGDAAATTAAKVEIHQGKAVVDATRAGQTFTSGILKPGENFMGLVAALLPVPTKPVGSLAAPRPGGSLAFTSTTPGLQGGGVVSSPSYARLAEHGPEIVLGPPSRQAFAQEFAGAIAQYLEAGRGTSTVNLVVDGKTLAQVVVPAMLEQQRRRQIGLP
jgi:hypothetical protein